MKDSQNKKKRTNNKWLALINIPIQMGVIIFVFAYFGKWLDVKYPEFNHLFVKMVTLIGIALAFYNINRQLKDINNSSE